LVFEKTWLLQCALKFAPGRLSSPLNLRPLLGVPKRHNPKGLGLCLGGYARLYALDRRPEYLVIIRHLLDLLEANVSRGY
jgi:hypothetical protein